MSIISDDDHFSREDSLKEGEDLTDSLLIEHLEIELAEAQLKEKLLEDRINQLSFQLQHNFDRSLFTNGSIRTEDFESESNRRKLWRNELFLYSLNSSFHLFHSRRIDEFESQSLYSNSTANLYEERNFALSLAFTYSLQFVSQIAFRPIELPHGPNLCPINWLLKRFPRSLNEEFGETDWFPVHLTVALDLSQMSASAQTRYLTEIRLIVQRLGRQSLLAEFSPLSVAVASKQPNLDLIQLLLDDSLWGIDSTFSHEVLTRSSRISSHSTIDGKFDEISSEIQPQLPSSNCIDEYFPCSWQDWNGMLPLMHACSYNSSPEIVSLLISKWPQSLTKKDNNGHCAVHHAAFRGYSTIIQMLLQMDPSCAFMESGEGALPLHYAVQNVFRGDSNRIDIVNLLLLANPAAASKADDSGALPLHLAVLKGDLTLVKLIHSNFPDAMYVVDNEGLLPIHYYSQRSKSAANDDLTLAGYLLQCNPQSHVLSFDRSRYEAAAAACLNEARRRPSLGLGPGPSPVLSPRRSFGGFSQQRNHSVSSIVSPTKESSKSGETVERPKSWRRMSWSSKS